MSNVVKFRMIKKPSRKMALGWLIANVVKFPEYKKDYMGDDLFYGWRFITGTDGVMYFANCIEPGIVEEELRAALMVGIV